MRCAWGLYEPPHRASSIPELCIARQTMTSQKASSAVAARRFDARGLRGHALKILGMALLAGGACSNASASENVPFEDLGGDQCFMFSALVPTRPADNFSVELPLKLVINSEEGYKKLFGPEIVRESCANVDPSKRIPKVDFSTKTVLGLWSEGSCAATGFEKKVLKDDRLKQIIYSVSVIESQLSCSGPGRESLNLIAIPKVPPGYKIVFERPR
jgi:hypothetical protein